MNHELQIKSNFWKYCHSTFESKKMSNPVLTNQPAIPFSKTVKGQSMSTNPFLPSPPPPHLDEKAEPTIERI